MAESMLWVNSIIYCRIEFNGFANSDAVEADLDEIIVTVSKAKVKPHYGLSLGNDLLKKCGDLIFDRPNKRIQLMYRAE